MAAETSAKFPRFSVVVPAYNAASTLARALDSILVQTWPAHEIIVVDDGSTDGTEEVLRAYADKLIYLRQENAGPSAARNRGVKAASGDWIAFLDADDWYYPQRLQAHADMIRADSQLDFLVASFDYRDDEGRLMGSSIEQTALGKRLLDKVGRDGHAVMENEAIGRFVAEQFSDTRCLSLPRKTFLDLGGFDTDLRICEDVVFMIRLCAVSSRAGVTCSSLAVYLVHPHGLIRSDRLRAQTETIRALNTLHGEMAGAPQHVRDAWRSLVKKAYRNLSYFLVKQGRRSDALGSLFRSFRFQPSWRDGRDLLSLLKG